VETSRTQTYIFYTVFYSLRERLFDYM